MSKRNYLCKAMIFVFVFAVLFSCFCFTAATANADTGPKPSVIVEFKNPPDETCYGTLISEHKSTGPWSAWDGDDKNYDNYYYYDILDEDEKAAWQAFVDYEDRDGYYYLLRLWNVSETHEIDWRYYPPSPFKILLYFPESDKFVSSDIYEAYAFHSYYTADISYLKISAIKDETKIPVERTYDYTWEILSFFVRVCITILAELGVAWLFKYRGKRQILTVLATNCVTQVLLNVAVNLIAYYGNWLVFVFAIIPLEIAVFAIETVVYGFTLAKYEQPVGGALQSNAVSVKNLHVLYAFAANFISFALGVILAFAIPGLF